MPKVHDLKIFPNYFADVISKRKSFEIRKNDRGFSVGDFLWLREYDATALQYTGRSCLVHVYYICDDFSFLPPDFVCMSIHLLDATELEYYDDYDLI